ncbi:MAG: helix-turn-helix domain-containing protein [Butyrivibrio sp.]|nr:helix-turn-helix domain-containing protein [Butyrivibrio sp.]
MSEYEDTLQAIKTTYGPLLRQKDLCEAAGICQTKAMKLIRSGQIPSVFLAEGRIRRYAILAEDAASFIVSRRFARSGLNEIEAHGLRIILSTEPDMLSTPQAQLITGINKNSVERWILAGKLPAIMWKTAYRIPKKDLIDYMTTSAFWKARTSSIQRLAIRRFLVWYIDRKENYQKGGSGHEERFR